MYTLETGSPFIFLKLAVHVVWRKAVHLYSMLKTSSPYSKDMQSMSILEAGSPCLLESGSLFPVLKKGSPYQFLGLPVHVDSGRGQSILLQVKIQ